MNKVILAKMQEKFNGCPLFIDREKGSLDDIIGTKVKIESYFKLTGDNGDYYAMTFVGDNEHFYLSGGAWTEIIAEFGDSAKEVEILVMEKIMTKNDREYRPIRVF